MGTSGYQGSTANYYTYLTLTTIFETPRFSINFKTSNLIYLPNIKVNVLLIGLNINYVPVNFYSYTVVDGSKVTKRFTSNFGVTQSDYGLPQNSYNCLMGFNVLDLYLDRNSNTLTYFYFNYTSNSITDVSVSNVWNSVLEVTCMGMCSTGTAYSSSSGGCVQCTPNCNTCLTATICLTCLVNFYFRSDNLCYATCLAGTYPNSTSGRCESCPSGCSSCSSLTQCSACASGLFLRSDLLCYATCLNGFYANTQNNQCSSCLSSCSTCTNGTQCVNCPNGSFLRADNLCYSSCLNGYFPDPALSKCTLCPV